MDSTFVEVNINPPLQNLSRQKRQYLRSPLWAISACQIPSAYLLGRYRCVGLLQNLACIYLSYSCVSSGFPYSYGFRSDRQVFFVSPARITVLIYHLSFLKTKFTFSFIKLDFTLSCFLYDKLLLFRNFQIRKTCLLN